MKKTFLIAFLVIINSIFCFNCALAINTEDTKPTQKIITPQVLSARDTKNYKVVNELAMEAFKNIPDITEVLNKYKKDPDAASSNSFIQQINCGNMEYSKEYVLGSGKEKTIKVYSNEYVISSKIEKFTYGKNNELTSYSLDTSTDYPLINYSFKTPEWKLESLSIIPKKDYLVIFNSSGKFVDYNDYLNKVIKTINKKYKKVSKSKNYNQSLRSEIIFTVAKDGKITSANVYKPSGYKSFDNDMLDIVNSFSYDFPFTKEITFNKLNIKIFFDYNYNNTNVKNNNNKENRIVNLLFLRSILGVISSVMITIASFAI